MGWYKDLDTVYVRYNAIFERVLRERDASGGRPRSSGNGALGEDYEGMFGEWIDAPKRSFGDFMQG